MCTASTATSSTKAKIMKDNPRFKAPNCRGGCISRKCRERAAACSRTEPTGVERHRLQKPEGRGRVSWGANESKHSESQPQILGEVYPSWSPWRPWWAGAGLNARRQHEEMLT